MVSNAYECKQKTKPQYKALLKLNSSSYIYSVQDCTE